MKTWKFMPIDRHFWAFYYYLKRAGARPKLLKDNGEVVGLEIEE